MDNSLGTPSKEQLLQPIIPTSSTRCAPHIPQIPTTASGLTTPASQSTGPNSQTHRQLSPPLVGSPSTSKRPTSTAFTPFTPKPASVQSMPPPFTPKPVLTTEEHHPESHIIFARQTQLPHITPASACQLDATLQQSTTEGVLSHVPNQASTDTVILPPRNAATSNTSAFYPPASSITTKTIGFPHQFLGSSPLPDPNKASSPTPNPTVTQGCPSPIPTGPRLPSLEQITSTATAFTPPFTGNTTPPNPGPTIKKNGFPHPLISSSPLSDPSQASPPNPNPVVVLVTQGCPSVSDRAPYTVAPNPTLVGPSLLPFRPSSNPAPQLTQPLDARKPSDTPPTPLSPDTLPSPDIPTALPYTNNPTGPGALLANILPSVTQDPPPNSTDTLMSRSLANPGPATRTRSKIQPLDSSPKKKGRKSAHKSSRR